MQLRVTQCQRCTQTHESLNFQLLPRPTDEWRWWAMCPVSKAPVMLKLHPLMHEKERILGERLDSLAWPKAIETFFIAKDIQTFAQLLTWTRDNLAYKGLGNHWIGELRSSLRELNLYLAGDEPVVVVSEMPGVAIEPVILKREERATTAPPTEEIKPATKETS